MKGILMPVLCTMLSVIIKEVSIKQNYKGEWNGFLDDIPNSTMCNDGELVRVGFTSPDFAQIYIDLLKSKGLKFKNGGTNNNLSDNTRNHNDIVVVDQIKGPITECDWIEFGSFPIGEDEIEVPMCWLFVGMRFGLGPQIRADQMDLSVPIGWTPEELSISRTP